MPPCSHRAVTAVRCAAEHWVGISAHRLAARSPPSNLAKAVPKSRPADARRRGYGRGRNGSCLRSCFREGRWSPSSPAADRKGDSDHASKVGESIHRRQRDTRNDAVPASNTL